MMTDIATLKVCLFDGVTESAVQVFKDAGFENIHLFPDSLPEDELKKELADTHIIGLRSKTKLPAETLAAAPNLLCIGRYGIGVDNVDLKAAEKQGVAVFNGPHSSTRSVAELVVGAVFAVFRKIGQKNLELHRGEWKKSAKNCFEVRGKTLGLIGYGNISSQVSIMAEGLGMNVIYSDVRTVLPYGNAKQVSFDDVLAKSDIISLHVPGGKATENMINEKTIAKMKDGAAIINYARGSVIDIPALKAALESGKIVGAALDVFPKEPKKGEEFTSELRGVENVIFTPHVGGSTEESQVALGAEVSEKMKNNAVFGDSSTALNFPALTLGATAEGEHRVLVIHHNEPGVLASINDLLADENINITAQVLRTSETVGAVAIDVEKDVSESLCEKIGELAHIVQCRVIV
jgi:D-3-phosphoglycerate dehydrogenase